MSEYTRELLIHGVAWGVMIVAVWLYTRRHKIIFASKVQDLKKAVRAGKIKGCYQSDGSQMGVSRRVLFDFTDGAQAEQLFHGCGLQVLHMRLTAGEYYEDHFHDANLEIYIIIAGKCRLTVGAAPEAEERILFTENKDEPAWACFKPGEMHGLAALSDVEYVAILFPPMTMEA